MRRSCQKNLWSVIVFAILGLGLQGCTAITRGWNDDLKLLETGKHLRVGYRDEVRRFNLVDEITTGWRDEGRLFLTSDNLAIGFRDDQHILNSN